MDLAAITAPSIKPAHTQMIVQDESGSDIFDWRPRPKGTQALLDKMKAINADFETTRIALQNWHNNDKGESLYRELSAYFKYPIVQPTRYTNFLSFP